MALDAITRLAIAELVIYVLLLPLIVYILVRHGRRGLDGWGFLIVFCILRVVSSGLQIGSTSSNSSTGGIINSIGISALLLALGGIVTEAYVSHPQPQARSMDTSKN
jgi:hypothetical protein